MPAVKSFAVVVSVALLSFAGAAVELPEGVKVAKDGTLSFPGGSVRVWVPQVGWSGSVQFAPVDPVERNGQLVVSGDCGLGMIKGRYEYRFAPTSKTALDATWSYRMESPIDTAVSCAGISVNHADVHGVFQDGVYRPIPLAAGQEYTFHPKELTFVLEGGRTLTVRHGNVHYIDNRRFGDDSSGFRLLMDRPSGKVTENALKTTFAFGAVPQAACALNGRDVRSPVAEIAGAGIVTNGGVQFACCGQVFEAPVTLAVPKGRAMRGVSLMHATEGALDAGEVVGTVEVSFADGKVQRTDVVYGTDIGAFEGVHELKNAKPAVQKWNIVRFDGLYASHFPFKAANVSAVRLVPRKGKWLVAAATFTEAPVSFRTYDDKPLEIREGKDWARLDFTGNTVKGSALDFSGFAEAPAGREGFVRVSADGDFYLEKTGRKIRFNGANVCGSPLVAEAADVEEMVSRMKRCGYNAVRFHHCERQLVGKDAKSGLDFDPALLDRFLRTWAICATNGLYITYDIYSSREVYPGEIAGVTKKHGLGIYKAMLPINRAYVENLKAFCRKLLLTKNPYTGVTLAEDPAVMGVNIVNEDDIGYYWLQAKDAWEKAYAAEREKYPDFPSFRYAKQAAFHREMMAFCRDEIDIKAPLTGMNMTDRLDLTPISANFDWVDKHCYYSHPNPLKPSQGALVPNAYSQTGSPIQSLASPSPRQIMISQYAGKPMGSTEYNYCYPNAWRHEGVPMFMAYAAYQGWDAFFRFMWSCGPWSLNKPFRAVPFEESSDPVMQLSDRIAAALFLRGDLKPASRGYAFKVPADDKLQDEAKFGDALGLVARLAATTDVAKLPAGWKILEGAESLDPADAKALQAVTEDGRATTPDGQIDLDAENRTLRIVTPKTEVLSAGRGDLVGAAFALRGVRGEQTVAAISLDGKALGETERAVLIQLPDVQNTGVRFNNELKTVQQNWGELPYLVRRVKAEVELRTAKPLKVTALSGDGAPLGEVKATHEGGVLRFTADPAAFAGGALAYVAEAMGAQRDFYAAPMSRGLLLTRKSQKRGRSRIAQSVD